MLDNSLVNQGNTGLKRFSSTPSTSPLTLNSASMNPQGQYSIGSGTGISSVANASPGTSGQPNGSSLTNSYLNALKTQQGATAAAQSLSGYTAPDPNEPTPALPQLTPEQQQQFQTMFGQMNGLNAVTPSTPTVTGGNQSAYAKWTQPPQPSEDKSRVANDPFKTNVNALR